MAGEAFTIQCAREAVADLKALRAHDQRKCWTQLKSTSAMTLLK
jgi:hypothetical protein